MKNAEHGREIGECDLNATSKPPQSVLIANRLRPQSHPKANPMRPQCDPNATPMRPQCDPKATARPAPLDQLAMKSTFPADSTRPRLGLSLSGQFRRPEARRAAPHCANL